MYSMVLFMVDTSLSGFLGSGDMPMSAVDMMAATVSSGDSPGELDEVHRARAGRAVSTSSSKQSPEPIRVKEMSVRCSVLTTIVRPS